MIKTRRYKTIYDGRRKFVGFDRICIDPATTDLEARKVVDRSEVDRLADEFARIELSEDTFIQWQTAKYKLRFALQRYEKAVSEYARAHPIHFNPREGEEIYCPLIEYAKP